MKKTWTQALTVLAALLSVVAVESFGSHHALAAANVESPQRLVDTRTGLGGHSGRLQPGTVLRVDPSAAGAGGATAVALNLTAVDGVRRGNLSAWPCSAAQPNTSVLNFASTLPVANAVVVGGGSDDICIRTTAAVNVVVDLTAWFTGTDVHPITPERRLDTRTTGERLRANTTRRVRVTSPTGIPSSAASAIVNLTVADPSKNGFLVAFPCSAGSSTSSTMNFAGGENTAAMSITTIGGGDICVRSNVDTDLVVDSFGWIPASSALKSITPKRILDTRSLLWSTGIALSDSVVKLRVAGRGGVPNDAMAAVLTLTATGAAERGFVTAWPCDQPRPTASVLNARSGASRANLAIVQLSATSGEVCLYAHTANRTPLHLVADAIGFVPGGPSRTPPPAPPVPSRFVTLPVGSTLPSGAECAARVRPAAEIRPGNYAANHNRGGRAYANTRSDWLYYRVDGDFAGTTDEIIQWAACKWGLDEDMARAQVVKESWWHQSANGDNGESWGLGQVRVPYHQSAFQYSNVNARNSSAYNLDYTFANWRSCFDGTTTWLNTVEHGRPYVAGDAWGCMGVWFAGRWYTQPAINYIEGGETNGYGDRGVKQHYTLKTWTDPNFING